MSFPRPQPPVPSPRFNSPQPPAPNPRVHRGLTLLEVLIAIGVLLFGLLGVAALIPIGVLAVQRVEQSDRTGACGRAAIRDVRIRNLLDCSQWNYPFWEASKQYPANSVILCSTNGHFYVSQNSVATSNATEPTTWPTNGSIVVDGGMTWTDLGTTFVIDPEGMATISNQSNSTLGCNLSVTPVIRGIPRFGLWGMQVWSAQHSYSPGALIVPTATKRNGHCYRCTTQGINGNSEPTWPINNTSVTDGGAGGVTWQDMGLASLLTDPVLRSQDDLSIVFPENQSPSSWKPGPLPAPYALGTLISVSSNGHWYRCCVSGQPGGTEPTWPTNGSTVTDGSATWLDVGPAPAAGTRPWGLFVQSDNSVSTVPTSTPASQGNCSWFFTVSPVQAEANLPATSRTAYNVSAVVCYGRTLRADSEHMAGVATAAGSISGSIGGVTVTLDTSNAANTAYATDLLNSVKKNQWVMLISRDRSVVQWYRVITVGDTTTPILGLVGPDWDSTTYNAGGWVIAVDGVTGVYSATIPVEK